MAMTEQDVADLLRSQGIDEQVIRDEAPYLAEHYADPDENVRQVIAESVPFYMQRTLSGGDRNAGGYSTDENDPAVSIGGYTAPARTDSRLVPSGSSAGSNNWFSVNGFSSTSGGPGGFGETYTALSRPSYLQGEYVAPTWRESFVAPTAESLKADPGYQARLDATQRGFERSAAARGNLLSGGFVGRTLPRALGEQAANEYGAAFGRAFDTYRQRYGQFQDAASLGAQARGLNEGAYQADVANNLNQFNTRYRAYQDSVQNNLGYARLGLDAALGGRPLT